MKVIKISEQIVQISCETKVELARMFCRFAEHYESPEFAGKIFTLGQFREWYSQKQGGWTYYEDWAGFNIPGYVFKPFKDGLFDPLTEEEQKLLEIFRYKADKFYVIGTCETKDDEHDEEDIMLHEIMHALFYLNPKYKAEVLKAMKPYNFSDLESHLKKLGYADKVMVDEFHAYVGASSYYLDQMNISYPRDLTQKLRSIKEKYLK